MTENKGSKVGACCQAKKRHNRGLVSAWLPLPFLPICIIPSPWDHTHPQTDTDATASSFWQGVPLSSRRRGLNVSSKGSWTEGLVFSG